MEETPLIEVNQEKIDLRKKEPPLVDIKISNPVSYLKSWWKRIIGNEGIDFKIRVRPLTAIAITIIALTISLGIGRFVLPFEVPFFEYTVPSPAPQIQEVRIDSWRETAFSGQLQFSSNSQRYYLSTATSEAITLEVPKYIDLSKLISKRIFATGLYNENTRVLLVKEASDLEILPKVSEPIPTIIPESSPESIENNIDSGKNQDESEGYL